MGMLMYWSEPNKLFKATLDFNKDYNLETVNTYKDLPIFFKGTNLEGLNIEDVKLENGV